MLPLLPAAGAALGALYLAGSLKKRYRRRSRDPRTAVTGRLHIADARLATTRRMARVNPGVRRARYRGFTYILDFSHGQVTGPHYEAAIYSGSTNNWKHVYDIGLPSSITTRAAAHTAIKQWIDKYIAGEVRTNPRSRRMPASVGAAAARVAQWRWHHNPIPAGYQSRAGRRIAQEIRNGSPLHYAIHVGILAARQAGDHVALEAIQDAGRKIDILPSQSAQSKKIVRHLIKTLGGDSARNPNLGFDKPYLFTFHPRGKAKRVRWIRYGKDMNSMHELAKQAAKHEYPGANGFCSGACPQELLDSVEHPRINPMRKVVYRGYTIDWYPPGKGLGGYKQSAELTVKSRGGTDVYVATVGSHNSSRAAALRDFKRAIDERIKTYGDGASDYRSIPEGRLNPKRRRYHRR